MVGDSAISTAAEAMIEPQTNCPQASSTPLTFVTKCEMTRM